MPVLFQITHSDVSCFAKKIFSAAPKSSLDNASSSGNPSWFSTGKQSPVMTSSPTSGIGSTREAQSNFDLQKSRPSGMLVGCTKALVDFSVMSTANVRMLSPLSLCKKALNLRYILIKMALEIQVENCTRISANKGNMHGKQFSF